MFALSPAFGAPAVSYVFQMITSLSQAPGVYATLHPSAPHVFSITVCGTNPFDFSVGAPGTIPLCVVQPTGCSFNPDLYEVVPENCCELVGDIDGNGIPYEQNDATIFSNYFVQGLSALPEDLCLGNTDVDGDGLELTVADMVYLVQVITGGAVPIDGCASEWVCISPECAGEEVTTCCTGRVGDANGEGGDEPTIGDASVMIDAKFITGTCDGILECLTKPT